MMRPFEHYLPVTDGEFPHGLCCAECKQEITVGHLYTSRPESISETGSLMEELVCATCG